MLKGWNLRSSKAQVWCWFLPREKFSAILTESSTGRGVQDCCRCQAARATFSFRQIQSPLVPETRGNNSGPINAQLIKPQKSSTYISCQEQSWGDDYGTTMPQTQHLPSQPGSSQSPAYFLHPYIPRGKVTQQLPLIVLSSSKSLEENQEHVQSRMPHEPPAPGSSHIWSHLRLYSRNQSPKPSQQLQHCSTVRSGFPPLVASCHLCK